MGEVLVLVGRETAAVDPEAAAEADAHRLGGGGPVEGGRDRGAPVDDDRVAVVVADVPAADVEGLLAVLGAAVDATEEERGARVVLEGGDPAGEDVAEHRGVERVARGAGVEPVDGRTHPGELGAGSVQVGLLGREDGVRGRWGGRRGHGGTASCRRGGSGAGVLGRAHTGEPMMVHRERTTPVRRRGSPTAGCGRARRADLHEIFTPCSRRSRTTAPRFDT
ncbi:hypothetical protein [Phycicoccus sp. CSK15P-2]|uniref:hypothetical protein n=1 Tax=Phycicoccus sp. CSK15P-2 TaxID=2807627 RepID=UPI0027DE1C6D|nr:hypothetical protein [Phycicoccus sp. CSK15P-2]